MATVKLDFGTSVDLEDGEEIIMANVPLIHAIYEKGETFMETLVSKFTLGIVGPKRVFKCNLVITDKRLVLVPYPNQKITKDQMFQTRSLYYHKDIKGVAAMKWRDNQGYNEVLHAWFEVTPVKGVKLRGLNFMVSLNLSQEEMSAVAKSMRDQVSRQAKANAALQSNSLAILKSVDLTFTEAFKVQMMESFLKSEASRKSGNPDISILPMRDFLVWTINNAIADAK